MKMTAEEIAKIINGKVAGDKNIIITGASNLSDAGAADITFFGGDKKLLSLVPDTKAGVIIYPDNMSYERLENKNLILFIAIEVFICHIYDLVYQGQIKYCPSPVKRVQNRVSVYFFSMSSEAQRPAEYQCAA